MVDLTGDVFGHFVPMPEQFASDDEQFASDDEQFASDDEPGSSRVPQIFACPSRVLAARVLRTRLDWPGRLQKVLPVATPGLCSFLSLLRRNAWLRTKNLAPELAE